MGMCKVRVSNQLLTQVLGLPAGTEVVYARTDELSMNSVILTVAHEDLPEVQDCGALPFRTPVVQENDGLPAWVPWDEG